MTTSEYAQLRERMRRLFGGGDDDEEIQRLLVAACADLDFETAIAALDQYALHDGGPKRRFIPGKFLRAYEAQPKPKRVVRIDREAQAREAALLEARRAESAAAIREERDMIHRTVKHADPRRVAEIVEFLVSCGARRPAAQVENWPWLWTLAVADILLDRVRAAPTEAGYFAQVSDDRGAWVDDPTRPLRPLPPREWWAAYGVPGMAARGLAEVR